MFPLDLYSIFRCVFVGLSAFSFSSVTEKHALKSEQSTALYALSQSIQLSFLPAVTSSTNTSKLAPLAAIHGHVIKMTAPCLTDDVVCFGSGAASLLLYSPVFPSFWHKLISTLSPFELCRHS